VSQLCSVDIGRHRVGTIDWRLTQVSNPQRFQGFFLIWRPGLVGRIVQ